ncbi:MAG TPA: hypothetical protein VMX57_09030, partial [Planctomycetota bacterium]|nr:hypothetical protein [Planctomycetota bacterium]
MGGIFSFGSEQGKSKKQSITTLPAPTQEEQALMAAMLQLAGFQISNLNNLAKMAQSEFGIVPDLFKGFATDISLTDLAAIARPEQIVRDVQQARQFARASTELLQYQLETIRTGGAATPEQKATIKRATDAQLARVESDIDRSTKDTLTLLREELSPGLGLRSSDTPILDRGGRIAEEATRQKGQAAREAQALAATQELQLPVQLSNLASGQQDFVEGSRQYQETLALQDFMARQGLIQPVNQFGLGLSNIEDISPMFGQSQLRGLNSPTVNEKKKWNIDRQGLDFEFGGGSNGGGDIFSGLLAYFQDAYSPQTTVKTNPDYRSNAERGQDAGLDETQTDILDYASIIGGGAGDG